MEMEEDMVFEPTEEQVAVIDMLPSADRLKVVAGAGAGKTATLVQCDQRIPSSKRVLYTAFNKAIVDEGKRKFSRAKCYTSHKLAYDAVAKRYRQRLADSTRMPARQKAMLLGIEPIKVSEDLTLGAGTLARLASDGVDKYCNSADQIISWYHLPKLDGLDSSTDRALREYLVPYAQRIWEDLLRTDAQGGGKFPFSPNHFRKIWQLSQPVLPYDVILLDEAQDTAPVFMDVLQRQEGAQLVLIGDPAQSINEWAGAVDAIGRFDAPELRLTRSFRFGQEVAAEGNKWLELLGTDMRITGTGTSRVGDVGSPTAVLTRTNGEAVRQLMASQSEGLRTALAGQKARQEVEQLCAAADDLKQGKGTWVKSLIAFTYWSEVQEYAEQEDRSLLPFVRVVDEYGTGAIRAALKGLVPMEIADRVISTAHVSKGLEFERVLIGDDFVEPTDSAGKPVDPSPQDIKLAYVAVTRAKAELDLGSLDWIDERVAGGAREAVTAS